MMISVDLMWAEAVEMHVFLPNISPHTKFHPNQIKNIVKVKEVLAKKWFDLLKRPKGKNGKPSFSVEIKKSN